MAAIDLALAYQMPSGQAVLTVVFAFAECSRDVLACQGNAAIEMPTSKAAAPAIRVTFV